LAALDVVEKWKLVDQSIISLMFPMFNSTDNRKARKVIEVFGKLQIHDENILDSLIEACKNITDGSYR
jgi:hypothetical protein